MIDTLSSAFWILSEYCALQICQGHKKYTPIRELGGRATIELNDGIIRGDTYFTAVHLNSFLIPSQSIFLVNSINVTDFEVNL